MINEICRKREEIIKTDRHLIKKGRFMYIGRQYEYGGVANAICNYTAICRQHQF